jgi:hypothetical protein
VADLLKRHGFQQVHDNRPGHVPTGALPFPTLGQGHHRRATERPEGWKFAATIRHHYDVIIAWMFAKRVVKLPANAGELTFEAFKAAIENMHTSANGLYYPKQDSLLPHMNVASFVIEYQYLQKDTLMFLGETVGLHDGGDYDFPHIGASKRNGLPALDVLTPEMQAYIHDRYGEEMEDWGFLVDGKAVGYQ